ncbi:MAG: hypothetical protein EBU90_13705 [Proteobacteria bacterium]|nr:hypothetical protein [Pseudomonadota bacterium]
MQKVEEIPYITRYYDVIVKNDNIFNKLKKIYPELEIDLISSKENPSCECKNRVINYLTIKLNIEKDRKIIEELIEDPSTKELRQTIDKDWEFMLGEEAIRTEQYSYEFSAADRIYKVEKSDQAWKEFLVKIRASLIFQSFSVVDKETHLEVYFI